MFGDQVLELILGASPFFYVIIFVYEKIYNINNYLTNNYYLGIFFCTKLSLYC